MAASITSSRIAIETACGVLPRTMPRTMHAGGAGPLVSLPDGAAMFVRQRALRACGPAQEHGS